MNWIKVEDQLPKIGQSVISTDGDLISRTSYEYNKHINEYYWPYFSSGCGCCDTQMKNVTHWMSLPDKPSDI